MTDKPIDLDLDAIEALCEAAHVDMLDGMFARGTSLDQATLWYPDGDLCAMIEENLGLGYFSHHELAELFTAAPRLIPALAARVRELSLGIVKARAGEALLYNLLERVAWETGTEDSGAISHELIDEIVKRLA